VAGERRVLYNRASADAQGKPWDPKRPGIVWNGKLWVGDVPTSRPNSPPGQYGAFIQLPEGSDDCCAVADDGPVRRAYEATERQSRIPLHPK